MKMFTFKYILNYYILIFCHALKKYTFWCSDLKHMLCAQYVKCIKMNIIITNVKLQIYLNSWKTSLHWNDIKIY